MTKTTMIMSSERQPLPDESLFRLIASNYNTIPSVTRIARIHKSALFVLLSTIISLRTRDSVTEAGSNRLFALAKTAREIAVLDQAIIEKAIYPVGFYRTKAANIIRICKILVEDYDGNVPADKAALLKLPGVGIKTANLVLGLAFGIPSICVDIHVHRIANRIGWISTKTPEESEAALEMIFPRSLWIELNTVLVNFGQLVCKPLSPHCSTCPARPYCTRKGVGPSR